MYTRREMLDLVKVDGHAKGIIVRNLLDGKIERYSGDAVLLCTGGYGNVFYLSTNAQGCSVTAAYRCYKRGAGFANPCFTQIHPTCIPQHGNQQSKLTLMSESLRNDGRVWVPKKAEDCSKDPNDIPEEDRDYYLERKYPSFGNLAPRDISSRAAKEACDDKRGVGPMVNGERRGVYLDFADAIKRDGLKTIEEKYGNLFEMYERITGENAYKTPMRIYPASHYTMGGLWVDYNLESTIPGLFVLGEANFSDHGANRLGASALMQGLADGYFVIPYTLPNYLAREGAKNISTDRAEFDEAEKEVKDKIAKLMAVKGTKSPRQFHIELGKVMWEYCGMARSEESLKKALELIPQIRERFWKDVRVVGEEDTLNNELERAGRVADFLEFAEIMVLDALNRCESCGAHFRVEYQTEDGEAKRNDAEYSYAAVWEYAGEGKAPILHKEPITHDEVKPVVRSYK